jgi:site-specific DNA-methyltransferase (adenine-specific)
MPYDTIQRRETDRPHPATFPPRLPEYCLRLHGLSRLRQVADPFLGLGSSAVACAGLGVDFVGIEIDEGYLKDAIARTKAAIEGQRQTSGRRRNQSQRHKGTKTRGE